MRLRIDDIKSALVCPKYCCSPGGTAKPLQDFVLLAQLDLDLFSHVENWTVAARAEDLLVKRALTTLALCPEARKFLLQNGKLRNSFLVDGALATLAMAAHGVRVLGQGDLQHKNRKTFINYHLSLYCSHLRSNLAFHLSAAGQTFTTLSPPFL